MSLKDLCSDEGRCTSSSEEWSSGLHDSQGVGWARRDIGERFWRSSPNPWKEQSISVMCRNGEESWTFSPQLGKAKMWTPRGEAAKTESQQELRCGNVFIRWTVQAKVDQICILERSLWSRMHLNRMAARRQSRQLMECRVGKGRRLAVDLQREGWPHVREWGVLVLKHWRGERGGLRARCR